MTSTKEPEAISVVLSRWKSLLALWTRREYRRNFHRLLWAGLRVNLGLRLVLLLLMTLCAAGWLSINPPHSPAAAYYLLCWIFAYGSITVAAPVFEEEKQQGTLELLWLATGSAKTCVRYKASVILILVVVFLLPTAFLFSAFFDIGLPFARLAVYLFVNCLFTTSLTIFSATRFPQPWAAALVSAIPVTLLLILAGEHTAFYNPFMNPFGGPQLVAAGGGAFAVEVSTSRLGLLNRILVIVLSYILLSTAARGLRRVFR